MTALRVLVAEDERLAAFLLRAELERQGFEVVGTAHTGLEALSMCQEQVPDLLLMDVQMPEMDGLEATCCLMHTHPTCILLVTAQPHLEQAAEQVGAMAYLLKPLSSSQLPDLIAAARVRFQHFLDLSRGAASLSEALHEWLALRQAVRTLMEQEDLSEEAAFARLSKAALAHLR